MSFAQELKNARATAGLTQEQVGEMVGLDRQRISSYESGRIANPSFETLEKFEKAFGMRFNVPADDGPQLSAKDAPPNPGKHSKGATKRAAPKSVPSISLADQLELPYKLGSDALRNRLPATSQILRVQARPCAEAWDQFLLRWPALREKIEQGMIAGDILGLIMAHVPIITTAREEAARLQQLAGGYTEAGMDAAA